MLNIEKYRDEIEKVGLDNFAINNGLVKRCDVLCSNCDFGENEASCCHLRIKWLCEEHKKPEVDWDNDIDWMKVPTDTAVLVKNKENQEWENKFFTIYFPEAVNKYAAFGFHDKQFSAINADMWKFCKLANPEDIEKYRKR